ncbi:hypothetical protein [Clostridium estertheticum]|nr:hypothetical protein [Clostridium estertheticum]
MNILKNPNGNNILILDYILSNLKALVFKMNMKLKYEMMGDSKHE